MKLLNRYIILFVGCLLFSLAFMACEEDEEPTPLVSNVRVVEKDSTISSAAFSTYLAIQGSGFNDVVKVLFNEVDANLNPNYVTSSNIIVQVPAEFPADVKNQVALITKSDKRFDFDFVVDVPEPLISDVKYVLSQDKVVISGENFAQINELSIGGIEITDYDVTSGFNEITFNLPDEVPVETVDVIINAAAGTTEVAFDLEAASKPSLTDVPAEWVDAGAMMKLNGVNLARIEKVTINGSIEVTSGFETNAINSWLKFPMPDGVDPGTITIIATNELGSTSNEISTKYKTSAFLWWDYDDKNFCWGAPASHVDDSQVPPTSGKFGTFEGKIEPSWWDQNNMFCGCFEVPAEIQNAPNDYVLKFEINVASEWSVGVFQITIGGDGGDEQFKYSYKPYEEGGSFVTEDWVTVTIPLSEFNIPNGSLMKDPRFKFFIPGDATTASENTAIYVDNLRFDNK